MPQITLHAYRTLALAAAVAALVVVTGSSTAMAQDHGYSLSYFANANTPGAPDGTLRIANAASANLCAAIYVFNGQKPVMEACCSCPVKLEGLLTLSINADITSNPTFGALTRGVIQIISSEPVGGSCNAADAPLHVGLHGWLTHPEALAKGQYSLSVEQLTDSTLDADEYANLQEGCAILIGLTDGGACRCAPAGGEVKF
jgi:hypothetical protein